MFTLPSELMYVTRTFFDTQLAGCNALLRTAFESGASMLDVNVHAARAELAAANAVSSELLFTRGPHDLAALTARESQQAVERAQRYGRHLAGIAHDVHGRLGELSKDFAGSLPRTSLE
ncbi:phasin protein [Pseudoduganella flava]|nr:phasin family protein [Pseudoduganella flava]TWI45979.1 phasin protein [Pseudoduganella flava]